MKKAHKRRSEPSAASLREMPEVSFKRARRGVYAKRIAAEGITIQVGPGRPKKGSDAEPSTPRSIRFPTRLWEHLEAQARAAGLTLHAALRVAVLEWVGKREREVPARTR
jgi:hypothetical protein